MRLTMTLSAIFLLFLMSSTYSLITDDLNGSPLSIIVKREADNTAQEPEVSTSEVPTQASILDIFSTSSKEKKPASAIMQTLHAVSNITLRYAKTTIDSKILNPNEVANEVLFDVIIPENAFISGFSIETGGKEYVAYVKKKEEAQKVYDQALKQGITAGHVRQSARDSNRFSISVNVEPQEKVKFKLIYEELLERRFGSYRHIINLNPGQIVEDVLVEIFVQENRNITSFRVPEFHSGNEIYPDLHVKDFDLAVTERISPSEVKVTFRPTVEDQKKLRVKSTDGFAKKDEQVPEGMSGQFAIEYDVERDPSGGEVLVNDGYFVHFFAPPEGPLLKKHVIFVLDVSGSMAGRKIEQLKQAMYNILDELKPHDFFNIVEFAFSVTVRDLDSPELTHVDNPWIDSLVYESPMNVSLKNVRPFPATPEYVKQGKEIVKRMVAAGGTNIYEALNVAMKLAKTGVETEIVKRSTTEDDEMKFKAPEPMIIFLTDGEPTVGERSESKILRNVDERNGESKIPIFSLSFGADADFNLLKKLSLITNAFARQIYEAADTSLQLTNFYRQISSPVLSDVKFVYPPEEVKNETITKVIFSKYFDGSELVVTGKLQEGAVSTDFGLVEAKSADGVKNFTVPHVYCSPPILKKERTYHPLERLWVYKTIRELLNEAELLKIRSYKIDYNTEDVPQSLTLEPEEKALRLALEAVKNTIYSFFRTIIDCLTAKLKLLQNLFQFFSNDYVYVDSNQKDMSKNINQTITELAVKYSFVCPLTSLVVVKPNRKLADVDLQPAVETPVASPLTSFAFGVPLTLGLHSSVAHVPNVPAPLMQDMSLTTIAHKAFQESGFVETTSLNETLDSVMWLSQVLTDDVLLFPGNDTTYFLGRNQTDETFGNCTVEGSSVNGLCRHLEHCLLPEIISNLDEYYPARFCLIPGNYAGVCCPW